MKKRVVAVLLSLTLCMATVLETGAAVFDAQTEGTAAAAEFGDSTDTGEGSGTDGELPVEITPTPVVTETPENPDGEGENPDGEGQNPDGEGQNPDGEGQNPDGEGQNPDDADKIPDDTEIFVPQEPETPADGLTDSQDDVELFTSGEDDLLGASALPSVIVEVNKTDWEETEPGSGLYKLHKDSSAYYMDTDGIVYIKTVENKSAASSDTAAHSGYAGYYLFGADGVMVTGRKVMAPGTPGYTPTVEEEFYYADSTTADIYSEYEGAGGNPTPVNSSLGQLKLKYWLWTGTTFRYYDSTGRFLSMDELDEIVKEKGTYKGFYSINGKYFCMDPDGTPRTGVFEIPTGTQPGTYYFQEEKNEQGISGEMFRGGWYCRDTEEGQQWLYFKSKGQLYERGTVATRLNTAMGNYSYLLSADGYIMKNTMAKASNNAYYGTDKYGRVYKEKLVKYNGIRYYFSSNGTRVSWKNCWHRCKGAGNRFYYFGGTPGKVVEKTGWQKVTSNKGKMYGWFYFSGSGNHYTNKWVNDRYFKEGGQLASGVTNVNGKIYFFMVSNSTVHRGSMFRSTWISYRSKWYYAPSNGLIYRNGWKQIDGNYYYFQDDFTTKTNAFVSRNGINGYVDGRGKFCTGWVVANDSKNQVRYVNPNGSGFVKDTSKVIDGLRYYFDKNGYRRNDLTAIYRGPYYLKVDRTNGVMTAYDSTGTVPVKTIRVSVGLPSTPTPAGTFYLERSALWQPLMGPSWGQYGSHVVGAGYGGIFVHSVACSQPNRYNIPAAEYNKLGNPASHGCIRTCVADAKWVYENCNNARITIYSGTYKANEALKGPLGRWPRKKLTGNFDPTDPYA